MVERRKILARRASVLQRIKAEMSIGEYSADRLIHLGGLLLRCKEDIEQHGGAPKKW